MQSAPKTSPAVHYEGAVPLGRPAIWLKAGPLPGLHRFDGVGQPLVQGGEVGPHLIEFLLRRDEVDVVATTGY
jgi:hypothetical protein